MNKLVAEVKTIGRDELRDELARHEELELVMSLGEWAFRAKRIPGSVRFGSSEEMLAALGKDDEIVVYCSNVDCHASIADYWALLEHGYTNVRRYAGGLADWEAAGLPLEGDWVSG
ncbi:MAG TPA: rhodanese-like domain-containing protein [Kofleriaceae bacterium]|nr:rhodanese-like domain-containing protein [Kofleriaceae bacterium]